MSTAADPIIAALRTEHDLLADAVARADVDGPSGASEWTVAQVLSHLGSGAEITMAGLDAAVTGHDERGPDFNTGVWDRWNAKSARAMADDFLTTDETLVQRYESLDEDARANTRIDVGFLPQPIDLATAAALRLNEVTLHAWDVLVAQDPAATLPQAGTDQLIDRFALLFGFLGHADAIEGRGTLGVRTTAPERTFGVEIADGGISLVDAPAEPTDVLTLPAEAWLRLITGRLPADHTPSGVSVSGDLVTLDGLRAAFPGY